MAVRRYVRDKATIDKATSEKKETMPTQAKEALRLRNARVVRVQRTTKIVVEVKGTLYTMTLPEVVSDVYPGSSLTLCGLVKGSRSRDNKGRKLAHPNVSLGSLKGYQPISEVDNSKASPTALEETTDLSFKEIDASE